MDDRRSGIALALFRMYAGCFWLAYGTSKFEPNWAGGKHEFLEAVTFSAKDTTEPFKGFLLNFVVPHQAVFAELIAYGETLVGIALLLGLLTKIGAAGSIFLALNYFFATGKFTVYFGVESLELMAAAVGVLLLLTPSNRYASLDSVLLRRRFKRRG